MKVRDLMELLSELPLDARDKEVYIDLPGEDEYKEMEFCPVVDPEDEDVVIGFVISQETPQVDDRQMKLPFDGVH